MSEPDAEGRPDPTHEQVEGDASCVVVGVGASAGGLESFKQLLGAMPDDPGVAFVFIQHLAPTHASMMASLLSKHSTMPVVEVQQDMAIRPNHVYMIPPNRFLGIDGAHLKLDRTRTDGGLRLPIDHFLTSLARSRENRAVAIILSGTGADGSMGIRQVKALGGMVLAQQPETAEFGGMPQAAIATGVVDFVLPIAEMPQAVTRYASHPYVEQADQRLLAETSPEDFAAVLAVLRTHASHDFRCYKKGTLNRRIQRRMGLHQLPSLSAYVSMLRAEPAEVQSLVKDLLIGVTKFQRDREAWRDLERKILPPMIESKGPDDTVRAWVPGCSSGEEAYSIAMLMDEAIRRQRKNLGIQIFATDLDPDAVEFARAGLYPSSSVDELPPDLLARHFEASGDQYRVHKQLRDSVVFAVQNLISDPPFSNLDLISCRNVLIYLEPELQHRLLDMFHFSLRSGGCLFLGNSESTGTRRHLFEEVSKQWRLYTRKDGSRSLPVRPRGASSPSPHLPGPAPPPERAPRPSRVEIARRMMLDTFVPPSVVVDGSFMIEYFHGSVRDHLDFPRGEMTSDLLEMAPPKLRGRLRTAIQEASTNRAEVQVTAQSTVGDGSPRTVRIAVRPIPAGVEAEPRFLVTFMTETTEPKRPARRGTAPAEDGDAAISGSRSGRSRRSGRNQTRLRDLEGELLSTKEDLQSTIEELEASNEELKASNEEVMSMNEELQSANEELETGREELQSLNEELNTVNNQLEEKVDEIEASNNDLTNLLASTDVATVFLDTEFCVRRFTDAAAELMNLRPADVGRPINEIASRVNDASLLEDGRLVLKTLQPVRREIDGDDDRQWRMRRVLPYRTKENRIEGVVVTFTDISSLKEAARQAEIRERKQACVARLGEAAFSSDDPQVFLDRVAEDVATVLGVPLVMVLQHAGETGGDQGFILRAGVGGPAGPRGTTRIGGGSESQAGFAVTHGGPVVVADIRDEKRFRRSELVREHGGVSGMSVLIGPPGAVWGVLETHDTRPRGFSAEDVHFLQAVGTLAFSMLQNHESKRRLRLEAERSAAIHDAVVLAAESESRTDSLKNCIRLVCGLTGWRAGLAHVIDDDHRLVPATSWYAPGSPMSAELPSPLPSPAEDSFLARAAVAGAIDWTNDLDGDPRWSSSDSVAAALVLPIKADERVVAVIEFLDDEEIVPADDLNTTLGVLAEQFGRVFERRMAVESREVARRRLNQIVTAAEIGLWEWHLRTDESSWNPIMFDLLGLARDSPASGKAFLDGVHPEDRAELRNVLDRVIDKGQYCEHQFRVVHPDGSVRWLSARGQVERDADGRASLMRGINLDITRRKQAEEEIRGMNELLEQRVAERGAVAEQRADQLRVLTARVTGAEMMERRRVARMLHDDLQQVLAAMGMRLSRLKRDEVESRDEELDEISRLLGLALSSCRSLVSDLSPPAVRDGDLASILRWLEKRFKKQHGLTIDLDIEKNTYEVSESMRGLVHRTVQELLFNIVKHSGVQRADVSLSRHEGYAEIRVVDHGCGFDLAEAREEAGRVGPGGGTGFGLLSIEERLRGFGASFDLTSEPDDGTKVCIRLPLRVSRAASSPIDGAAAETGRRSRMRTREAGEPLTALVVDDNTIMRDMVETLANGLDGVSVIAVADDGESAVRIAGTHHPDVVIMDVNMPGVNGVEATKRIRASLEDVAIVGVSMQDPEVEEAMRSAGAVEFVEKERLAEELPAAIYRAARRNAADPAGT